jgi:uncharacterized protein YktA (UPF0223 family)
MKRANFMCLITILTGCALCFSPGCGKKTEPERIVVRVNDYSMSVEDFIDEIEHSPYAGGEAKDFESLLDLAIRKQVLIQEAQRQGLDRQGAFMKTIERYWEQTLIRELLKKQTRRVSETISKDKQDKALSDWFEELYESSDIEINEQVLNELKVDSRRSLSP